MARLVSRRAFPRDPPNIARNPAAAGESRAFAALESAQVSCPMLLQMALYQALLWL